MRNSEKVKAGKFKGMGKREIASFMQENEKHKSRKAKKRNRQIDLALKKTYGRWTPIEDISRSFFIWKGKYSDSPKETHIANLLIQQNLRFFREVSFDMKKRFDFYIPLIDLIIEYDGGQHFRSFKEMKNDITKETMLRRLGVKYIRYNKTHDLPKQIPFDLVNHPVLK